MNKKFVSLWLLVTAALIIIVVISFIDDITIGDYTLKKAPIAETLLKVENDLITDTLSGVDLVEALEKKNKNEVDSTSKSILIIGDSMTFNLALRLAQYAKQNGHDFHSVNWDSSSTKIWANSDTLNYFINKYNVDFIFISLGSNELYFKDPYVRQPEVRKIIDKIGDIPYIWIGPPNWKEEDTGFTDMLARTCKPGAFFRTAGMKLARKKDHIHPTRDASALWVDSIMRWMPRSSHPILAEVPSDTIGKVNPNITFLKALNK